MEAVCMCLGLFWSRFVFLFFLLSASISLSLCCHTRTTFAFTNTLISIQEFSRLVCRLFFIYLCVRVCMYVYYLIWKGGKLVYMAVSASTVSFCRALINKLSPDAPPSICNRVIFFIFWSNINLLIFCLLTNTQRFNITCLLFSHFHVCCQVPVWWHWPGFWTHKSLPLVFPFPY